MISISDLPTINAILNGTSAVLLTVGSVTGVIVYLMLYGIPALSKVAVSIQPGAF